MPVLKCEAMCRIRQRSYNVDVDDIEGSMRKALSSSFEPNCKQVFCFVLFLIACQQKLQAEIGKIRNYNIVSERFRFNPLFLDEISKRRQRLKQLLSLK